jgi:CubicO group peptidase (beta-lactamase class C family)
MLNRREFLRLVLLSGTAACLTPLLESCKSASSNRPTVMSGAPSSIPLSPTAPLTPHSPNAIAQDPIELNLTKTSTPSPARTSVPTLAPYTSIPRKTDDGWQTTSLTEVGIDPLKISTMLGFIYRGTYSGDSKFHSNGAAKFKNIHSILIVKDGMLVFEEYFYSYYLGRLHDLASCTKSITSLLAGIALDLGYLKGVDQKVLPFFPEYLPLEVDHDLKVDLTIEDLLTMRTGFACDDWDPRSPTYHLYDYPFSEPDVIKTTLNFPQQDSHGTHYSYCSASTVLLGALLERATGMTVAKFAKQYLFDPLGLGTAIWHTLPDKIIDTAGSLQIHPREMARLGLMMLQNGNWQGQQLISPDWIAQSIQQHVALDFNQTWGKGYGYLWWLSDVEIAGQTVHSFAASGAGGQVIAVYPDQNMVVVLTGGNYLNDEGQPFQIMERWILPAVIK